MSLEIPPVKGNNLRFTKPPAGGSGVNFSLLHRKAHVIFGKGLLPHQQTLSRDLPPSGRPVAIAIRSHSPGNLQTVILSAGKE